MIHKQFGRWTVIGDPITTNRGERKWLCRCTCGTERYVLERSLKSGGSTSCGCLRKEKVLDARSLNLSGQIFGQLKVLKKCEPKDGRRGVWWLCRCDCGEEYEVPGTLLVTGRRTHCTSRNHEKNYAYSDITGMKFGRLTACHPSRRYDKGGSMIWRCRCDCGNEVDVSYNSLMYTHQKSCGCQKKEHSQKLNTYLTHVAGTSMEMLKSKKLPDNNTTGYKGVYLIRGKYVAKIVFQKKVYYLGTYDDIEDAALARKKAEELLFDNVTEHYSRWKSRADKDPVWANKNPVQVIVSLDNKKQLNITLLPLLTEQESAV